MKFDCDVIVIGAGPTGLTGAHLLATLGIRTLVIEKNPTTVQQPRAVSIDDEGLRTMQAAGLVADVVANVNLDYGFTIVDPKGREVYRVNPSTREYGYPKRNAFVQPILEKTLRQTLSRHEQASIRFETECVAIHESDDGVEVEVVDRQGQRARWTSRYLIGTDGGRSFVRGVIGATLQGSTYDARWLIVDLEGTHDRTRESCVYSDPARPAVNIPGPDGRRRFEFMLHPHESDDLAQDEAYIRGLLAAYGPDRDAHIVRRQVYTFHARVADRWQTRRIYLAGDAAHLTPPFAGQGVNSAFRDIHNITWKLAAVLRGDLGPRLLESYQRERAPHAKALIDLAVSNGRIIMPKPGLGSSLKHLAHRLGQRVPRIRDYYRQMKNKPKASYAEGFLVVGGAGDVGRLLVQPQLETLDRQLHLMDDLIGSGFGLLVIGANAQADAQQLSMQDWGLAHLCILAIVPRHVNLDRSVWTQHAARDINDVFRADEHSRVVLLRPDRYVALDQALAARGAAAIAGQVRDLVRSTWD